MNDPKPWEGEIGTLLTRTLGADRPRPDLASWRRRYFDAGSATAVRATDQSPEGPVRERVSYAAWLTDRPIAQAAVILVLVGLAAYGAYRLAGDALAASKVPGSTARPVEIAGAAGDALPAVVDTRGVVWSMPEGNDQGSVFTAGNCIPVGRTVCTCPYGALYARYGDGTFLTMDRSTTAVFSGAGNAKKVALKNGILFVTRKASKLPGDQVLIDAPQASIRLDQGQVVLVVNGDQTVVEVVKGTVRVKRVADSKTITVSAGQYALVGPGKPLSAVRGYLGWELKRGEPRTN
jgi:hypothetical protein